eukprot:COSAG02_NODE_5100_length_4629_cov_87.536424_2_plen_119_part_00
MVARAVASALESSVGSAIAPAPRAVVPVLRLRVVRLSQVATSPAYTVSYNNAVYVQAPSREPQTLKILRVVYTPPTCSRSYCTQSRPVTAADTPIAAVYRVGWAVPTPAKLLYKRGRG